MENKILDIGGGSMHSHRPYARDSPPLVGLAGEVHLPTRIQKRVQNPYISMTREILPNQAEKGN